jgi:Tol biopolymer transport system component
MRLKSILAVALGFAGLVVAAPAEADTIAYVKDHNVWVARPDGSGAHSVTKDGTATVAYRSPSMDDHGVIVAGHGEEIVRLRQSGAVLSHFNPPPAIDSTGDPIDGVPQAVAVSPDGSRIAFTYATYTCPPGADCGARQVLLYSYAGRATPVATFGEQFDLRHPAWIDDNRVLEFGGHFRQVNVDTPGGGNDDAVHWFEDAGNEDLGDGELSRAGDRFAAVRSYGSGTHIGIYHVQGGVGGSVDLACLTGTDATLSSPTWSPDGRALAFAHAQGIEVLPLPSVVAGDCPGATSSRLVIPGGQEPDWSPAPLETTTPSRPAAPAPKPRPATARISAPRSIRVAKLRRRGIVVRVTGPAGRVTVRATVRGRRVGVGRARLRTAGTVTVRVRVRRVRPGARLTLKATFAGGGHATARVRVRR